jgi:hypothetical protein
MQKKCFLVLIINKKEITCKTTSMNFASNLTDCTFLIGALTGLFLLLLEYTGKLMHLPMKFFIAENNLDVALI